MRIDIIIYVTCSIIFTINIIAMVAGFPFTVESFINLITQNVEVINPTIRDSNNIISGRCDCCDHFVIKNDKIKRCPHCYSKIVWTYRKDFYK